MPSLKDETMQKTGSTPAVVPTENISTTLGLEGNVRPKTLFMLTIQQEPLLWACIMQQLPQQPSRSTLHTTNHDANGFEIPNLFNAEDLLVVVDSA